MVYICFDPLIKYNWRSESPGRRALLQLAETAWPNRARRPRRVRPGRLWRSHSGRDIRRATPTQPARLGHRSVRTAARQVSGRPAV